MVASYSVTTGHSPQAGTSITSSLPRPRFVDYAESPAPASCYKMARQRRVLFGRHGLLISAAVGVALLTLFSSRRQSILAGLR